MGTLAGELVVRAACDAYLMGRDVCTSDIMRVAM